MLILQTVLAAVFMERHWQMVTERMSSAVTRDIAAIIGEADVKEQALAWVPAVMRFGTPREEAVDADEAAALSGHIEEVVTEKAA